MSKIEQLLKRYEHIRKGWVNSRTPEEEQEWYDKLQMIEKEIKAFKARKGGSDLGSEVMAKYIGLKEKGSQEG
jgi:hypothetical protein